MELNGAFLDTLSRLRLSMGHKSSMNLTGNRKSVQKGSSTEFSDFREYMPGDDIRRIDWNAYGRLDRLYVKEYMEEKEAVVTILIDTSASMDYGKKKKSELACMLAAAFSYLSLNNMDRVVVYDLQRIQSPLSLSGGKRAFPKLSRWLSQCRFEGTVDVEAAIRQLPSKGPGVTFLISDFLQEEFLETGDGRKQSGGRPQPVAAERILRFLNYRRQKTVFLHVLAEEELDVDMTGTCNLIDMEDRTNTLRLTLDVASIRVYTKGLEAFCGGLRRACAKAGAVYAVCSTGADFNKLIFQNLKMLYDI